MVAWRAILGQEERRNLRPPSGARMEDSKTANCAASCAFGATKLQAFFKHENGDSCGSHLGQMAARIAAGPDADLAPRPRPSSPCGKGPKKGKKGA